MHRQTPRDGKTTLAERCMGKYHGPCLSCIVSEINGNFSWESQNLIVQSVSDFAAVAFKLMPIILTEDHDITPHLYNTDYYITKLNRLTSSVYSSTLVSSTIVISVVSTFNIAIVFLNLYAVLLFIVKSSLQCATEILINLIEWLIFYRTMMHGLK